MNQQVNSELISQAAYARDKGVSRQAVNDLVKRGIIPLIDGKIDPAVADLKITTHLDPAKSKTILSSTAAISTTETISVPQTQSSVASYQGSKATREHYEALKRKLEYEKLEGSLLERDAVERALTEAGRMLRDSIMAVPIRIAGQTVAMTDAHAIEKLIANELRRALENFAKIAKDGLARVSN